MISSPHLAGFFFATHFAAYIDPFLTTHTR